LEFLNIENDNFFFFFDDGRGGGSIFTASVVTGTGRGRGFFLFFLLFPSKAACFGLLVTKEGEGLINETWLQLLLSVLKSDWMRGSTAVEDVLI
jgi:hypothetical protein